MGRRPSVLRNTATASLSFRSFPIYARLRPVLRRCSEVRASLHPGAGKAKEEREGEARSTCAYRGLCNCGYFRFRASKFHLRSIFLPSKSSSSDPPRDPACHGRPMASCSRRSTPAWPFSAASEAGVQPFSSAAAGSAFACAFGSTFSQKQPAEGTVGQAVFSVGSWRFFRRDHNR